MPHRCFSAEQQRGEPLVRCLTTRVGPLESRRLKLPGAVMVASRRRRAGAHRALPQLATG
jgi:hypothetical protein